MGDNMIANIAGSKETFTGAVDFISPQIDPITRTISIRTTLTNTKNNVLRPNLYMDVSIMHSLPLALTIPTSAIIRLKNLDYVITQNNNKQFVAKEVSLGTSSEGYTQIIEGLSENENVVTSSQFFIDSESNVQASLQRFTLDNKQKAV